jgi:hypothetical protein
MVQPPPRPPFLPLVGCVTQSSVALLGDLLYRITGVKAVGLSDIPDGDADAEVRIPTKCSHIPTAVSCPSPRRCAPASAPSCVATSEVLWSALCKSTSTQVVCV